MKYFSKHTEVDVVRLADGSYDVTIFGKKKVNLTQEELLQNFTLSKQSNPLLNECKQLARKIVESELMVDDGNGEELLHEAVGYAQQIIKKLT